MDIYSMIPYLSKYSDLETTVIIFDPELKFTLLKQQLVLSDSVNLAIDCSKCTRVGTLIVATIYLQLIQNRYMFRSIIVLQCSHQHCVQPVASDVEVVEYL